MEAPSRDDDKEGLRQLGSTGHYPEAGPDLLDPEGECKKKLQKDFEFS